MLVAGRALEDYAMAHRMLVADVERRFLIAPDDKITERARALRRIPERGEPSGLDIPARRLRWLTRYEQRRGDPPYRAPGPA